MKLSNLKNLNPVFYERTKDGEVFYDIQSRLIKDRVIFLCEPITQEVAGVISSLLFMMNNEDPNTKISIWLNTPGGDAYAFFAIYDMIQMIQAPVETVCIGMAMSAGALLLSSGSKGQRLATTNSSIMLHQIQVGGISGTGNEIKIAAKEIEKKNNTLFEILSRHTGKSVVMIAKDCEHDLHLTAQEALEYGIVDKIIPAKKLISAGTIKGKKASKKKASKKKASKNTGNSSTKKAASKKTVKK